MIESASRVAWRRGEVAGVVDVPTDVAEGAAGVARDFFAKATAEEFSGELVDEVWTTAALPEFSAWFPAEKVRELGFEAATGALSGIQILATAGIDSHVDDIHGYVLIWVLHNDGLAFRQGKVSHVTRAGEWFIFDDRLGHAVRDTKRSTSYVCVSVPLRALVGE